MRKVLSPALIQDIQGDLKWPTAPPSFWMEIGELPLELQPKRLRVIQDGEFERLGKTIESIPVTVMNILQNYYWPGNLPFNYLPILKTPQTAYKTPRMWSNMAIGQI